MGRKNSFDFKKYVFVDVKSNLTICLLCNKALKGKRAGNIKRHYGAIHNIKISENESKIQPSTSTNCAVKQKPSPVTISMGKNEFLICCVGLVAAKNIPLSIFDDDEYFKKILRPYEDMHGIDINSRNIVSKIDMAAAKIKENIADLVHNKMICLKVDVATRMDKSILSINIQYIKDSKININTIGVVQLKKNHTAQFLRSEIFRCLKEYNIDISQIYAYTSDSGANVIKTAKLLQENQDETMSEEDVNSSSDDDDDDDIDDDLDDDFENIHTSLSSVMPFVTCAAYTIQLAAQDVLKTIQAEVEECRKVVINLRAHIQKENLNLPMPIIDNATRWTSTFEMIKSLENSKEYLESTSDINVPDPNWNFITKFLNAFQPLLECTNKFQSEQYIIGDFFRDWLCCEIDLEELSSQKNIFADILLNAMKDRKHILLTNKAFISAIYVDPRFNFTGTPFLSEEHKKTALDHLLKTHLTIKRLAGQNTDDKPVFGSLPPVPAGQFGKLEAKMNLLFQQTPLTDQGIEQKIESLCSVERAPFATNILEYYENSKIVDPELSEIFDVALSVPSTHFSVERALSALSIILTKTRSKLSKDTINNLLLIKLNENLIGNIIITDDSGE